MHRLFVWKLLVCLFLFCNVSCSQPVIEGGLEVQPLRLDQQVPIVYSPKYKISVFGLEKFHPFDIAKYDKIYAALEKDGLITQEGVVDPMPVTDEQMKLVHSADYLVSLKDSKKVAVYLESPQMKILPSGMVERMIVGRFRKAAGGTIEAGRLALKHASRMAFNLGGGYHHAKPDVGEGFCIISDVPIAIRVLQKEGLIKRALVIDTDIHQGNGTIVSLEDDDTTFTFSMHEAGIYPLPKEKGDLDVIVRAGVTDEEYLEVLKKHLDGLFKISKPNIVFHVAGCDALAGDPLANGQMTDEGIAKRDLMVVEACRKHGVPYVMTLSGGYSKDAWNAQYKSIKGIIENYVE